MMWQDLMPIADVDTVLRVPSNALLSGARFYARPLELELGTPPECMEFSAASCSTCCRPVHEHPLLRIYDPNCEAGEVSSL
jgi:hypothetical protein